MGIYKIIQPLKELFGFCGAKGCLNKSDAVATFTAHLENGKTKKFRHKLCIECLVNCTLGSSQQEKVTLYEPGEVIECKGDD